MAGILCWGLPIARKGTLVGCGGVTLGGGPLTAQLSRVRPHRQFQHQLVEVFVFVLVLTYDCCRVDATQEEDLASGNSWHSSLKVHCTLNWLKQIPMMAHC